MHTLELHVRNKSHPFSPYRKNTIFYTNLDLIYFSLQFLPPSRDLYPNSTSLAHFLHRYCSVLLCIYTRLAANRFLLDRILSELLRDIWTTFLFSTLSVSLGSWVDTTETGRNLFLPVRPRFTGYFLFFNALGYFDPVLWTDGNFVDAISKLLMFFVIRGRECFTLWPKTDLNLE